MMYIDVHCHLTGDEYDEIGGVECVLARASEEGVGIVIASGFDEAKLSVTGLIGSSNIIGKLDARKELSMYFVDEVCVYLADGKDFERVVRFFDIVLKSPLRNTNFVVVSTKSRTFCD